MATRITQPLNISGLTDEQAQEVHEYWKAGFSGFVFVAVILHALVWAYQPWIAL